MDTLPDPPLAPTLCVGGVSACMGDQISKSVKHVLTVFSATYITKLYNFAGDFAELDKPKNVAQTGF